MRRFTRRATDSEFAVVHLPRLNDRLNFVPPQPVLAVTLSEDTGPREAVMLNWGLIPSWAKDESLQNVTYKARSDCVATWAAFSSSFKHRRCLVVANGFFVETDSHQYWVGIENRGLLAFAGLWDRWVGPRGVVESCAIVVAPANSQLAEVADEMPVIVPRSEYATWISPDQQPEILHRLLRGSSRKLPNLEILELSGADSDLTSAPNFDADLSAAARAR